MDLACSRGSDTPTDPSTNLRTGTGRHGPAPLPAEDDEIPLGSSSEESQSSSDVSMSDSDDEGGLSQLISTGNEHIPTKSPLLVPVAAAVLATHQNQGLSRKRKSPEPADPSPSMAFSIKKVKLDGKGRDEPPSAAALLSDIPLLPAEIWHHIFTFTPPGTLGNLLRTNKLFNAYLDPSSRYQCKYPPSPSRTSLSLLKPDTIWQLSRRRFWHRMPAPLQHNTELDMWRLACGIKCQFCGKANPVSPTSPGDQRRHAAHPVWAFALRSCGPCLVKNTIKEIDLLLSSSVPSLLMSALPFALITSEMHTISPDALQRGLVQPDLQVTKIYLSEHVEKLKEEFLSVKSMGGATAEEWLKGLETRGKELLNDTMRWEKWASTGGVAQMQAQLSPPNAPGVTFSSCKGLVSADISSLAPRPQSSLSSVAGQGTCESSHITPSIATSCPRRFPAVTCKQNDPTSRISLSQHNAQPNAPRTRTREEALELKAARRAEIERRAMELDPPLPAHVLAHIPSFQAAIQIISPLDDNAWDLLKPRLLAQRADAEERGHEVSVQSRIAPAEEHRQTEENSIAAKQLIDKAWDDVQAPLRAQISAYADEIIRDNWRDGRRVDAENSPQFAAEVLLSVRKRFYAEIAKQSAAARAAGREPVEDPPEGPFTRRLTLENMKWLFDVKIKPHTEPCRKDLFFCNGCDANFKAFGFEGVIQHYAAKHTNALSLGSVVVHWRTEWPETPPFESDPRVAKTKHQPAASSYEAAYPQNNAGPHYHNPNAYPPTSNPASFQPSPYFTITPPDYGHSRFGPTTHYPAPYGQGNPYGPGQHGFGPPYSAYPSPYTTHNPLGATYPGSQLPFSTRLLAVPPAYPLATGVLYNHNSNAHQNNAQFNFQSSQDSSLDSKYHTQLEYLARTSRELWTSTASLKELPGTIRVRVVLHHLVQRFRSRFSESPPLSMFIDGLSNNKEMRPVRNVNGLICKACHLNLSNGMPTDQERRTFSLPQLVNHFQQRHVDQLQATGSPFPNWTVDMVHVPDLSVISSLHSLENMDSQKFSLISDAFPPSEDPSGHSYITQQPSYSAQVSQSISRYGLSLLPPMAEHDPVTTSIKEPVQPAMLSQRIDLDKSTMIGTPSSITRQKLQQGDSSRASSEMWPGSNGSKSKKQKGIPTKDRTVLGQDLKGRKGGGGASLTTIKSQKTNEEDLITEEERRREEDIRAMWAAERREAGRFTSKSQPTIDTKRNMSKSTPGVDQSRSRYGQATQIQGHQQPVAVGEYAEDDLMAGLESQLDRQQASSGHSGYRINHSGNASHEKQPFLGQDLGSTQNTYLGQGYSHGEVRPGSPVYVRHEPGPRFGQYGKDSHSSRGVGSTHESTRAEVTRDDILHDQPPRLDYHEMYTDGSRAKRPTSQYAEAYELVRVQDSRGEYFIRRPVRLEQESQSVTFRDGRAYYRDAQHQYRSYESDEYSHSRLGYSTISRTEAPLRQSMYEVGVNPIANGSVYEPLSRDDCTTYEDYDPRYPAGPPNPSIARQIRYE
ncbi:hypothetical protein F4677DRAFT_211621 [Hypoxylon crocopeplum]|nr:hypothetical protein F4677DRAFT_211621 [Hypoxylon crocopeplum]